MIWWMQGSSIDALTHFEVGLSFLSYPDLTSDLTGAVLPAGESSRQTVKSTFAGVELFKAWFGAHRRRILLHLQVQPPPRDAQLLRISD